MFRSYYNESVSHLWCYKDYAPLGLQRLRTYRAILAPEGRNLCSTIDKHRRCVIFYPF